MPGCRRPQLWPTTELALSSFAAPNLPKIILTMKNLAFPKIRAVLLRSPKMFLATLSCAGLMAGCATTAQPVRYQDLASAPKLNASAHNQSIPYDYSVPDAEWTEYTHFILDPVALYGGPDGQFGSASTEDKSELARYMQVRFDEMLRTRYLPASEAGLRTLRIHLTLTGLETNTPVLSTLSKVTPVGLLMNGAKSAIGTQARFSGSVSYAAEIYDSASGRLLRAYITEQYPLAVNVAASFGSLDAAKAGIRNGAEAMLEQIH